MMGKNRIICLPLLMNGATSLALILFLITWTTHIPTLRPVAPAVSLPLPASLSLSLTLGRLASLQTLEDIQSNRFGETYNFYSLGNWLGSKVRLEDLQPLLLHENTIVRAAGLYALSQDQGNTRLELFRNALSDSTTVPVRLVGTGMNRHFLQTTVGEIARLLLLSENTAQTFALLGTFLGNKSWPDRAQLVDVSILARDDCTHLHALASEQVLHFWQEAAHLNRLKDWQRITGNLSDMNIVKGLGRLHPNPKTRGFLATTLADDSLAPEVRLAAGSALTRDVEALPYLVTWKQELNRIGGGRFGTEFLQLGKERSRYQEILGRADQMPERFRSALFRYTGPYVLDYPALAPAFGSDRSRRARHDQVLTLAQTLQNHAQEWNTYRNAVHRLRKLPSLAGIPEATTLVEEQLERIR